MTVVALASLAAIGVPFLLWLLYDAHKRLRHAEIIGNIWRDGYNKAQNELKETREALNEYYRIMREAGRRPGAVEYHAVPYGTSRPVRVYCEADGVCKIHEIPWVEARVAFALPNETPYAMVAESIGKKVEETIRGMKHESI